MTPEKLIARLNWRQVVIHFIAAWFFMFSFQTLAVLHDISLVNFIRQAVNHNLTKTLSENEITASDLANFTVWSNFAKTAGLLVAFGISLTISIRRKWFWFNSLLVFVLAFVLSWFDLLGWTFLKVILMMPGAMFNSTTLEFLVNGVLILTLGLLTFFLAKINKFIDAGVRTSRDLRDTAIQS